MFQDSQHPPYIVDDAVTAPILHRLGGTSGASLSTTLVRAAASCPTPTSTPTPTPVSQDSQHPLCIVDDTVTAPILHRLGGTSGASLSTTPERAAASCPTSTLAPTPVSQASQHPLCIVGDAVTAPFTHRLGGDRGASLSTTPERAAASCPTSTLAPTPTPTHAHAHAPMSSSHTVHPHFCNDVIAVCLHLSSSPRRCSRSQHRRQRRIGSWPSGTVSFLFFHRTCLTVYSARA